MNGLARSGRFDGEGAVVVTDRCRLDSIKAVSVSGCAPATKLDVQFFLVGCVPNKGSEDCGWVSKVNWAAKVVFVGAVPERLCEDGFRGPPFAIEVVDG